MESLLYGQKNKLFYLLVATTCANLHNSSGH